LFFIKGNPVSPLPFFRHTLHVIGIPYWNLEQTINTHKEHMKPSKIVEKATHTENSTSTED